jgi:exodeoxyribonuclease-3
MKIGSFNVNSLRSRLPIVLQWLADKQPDILCAQETKVQDADFPTEAFDEAGYKYVFKGQKSYNGVAIFSKTKIINVKSTVSSSLILMFRRAIRLYRKSSSTS